MDKRDCFQRANENLERHDLAGEPVTDNHDVTDALPNCLESIIGFLLPFSGKSEKGDQRSRYPPRSSEAFMHRFHCIAFFDSSCGFCNHANDGIRAMAIGKSRWWIKIHPILAIAATGVYKPLFIPAAIIA